MNAPIILDRRRVLSNGEPVRLTRMELALLELFDDLTIEENLADLVRHHDCGWVIEPGDVSGLKQCLALLPQVPADILQKRRRAWQAAHAHYSMEAVGRHWLQLLQSINGS